MILFNIIQVINVGPHPVKQFFFTEIFYVDINIVDVNTRYATPPSRRRQNASVERQSNTALNFRHMFESLSGNRNQAANDDAIKNLQRLLEETLTKNMHLQKDLEAMSLQIQKQSSSNQ